MSRRLWTSVVVIAALVALPAGALARGGDGRPAATQAAAGPGGQAAPSKPPRRGVVRIRVGHIHKGRAKIMSRVPVIGTLTPFAPGQVVRVDFFLNGRKLATKKRRVRKARGGRYGVFRSHIRLRRGGKYAVAARYRGAFRPDRTVRKSWKVRYPSLAGGECGPVVQGFNRGLRRMGYIAARGSCLKGRTARGVLAYRKANGMTRNFHAGKRIVKRVFAGRGGYRVRHPGAGEHLEANLDKQVLVFAKGGRATYVYPMSSGAPGTPTVTGHFRFYLTQPGFNQKRMYYSFYFYRGYAIHGFASVPNYPASHGCLRTFMADQPEIYNRIDYGESIYVY